MLEFASGHSYRGIDHFMLKYAHTEQQHYPERTGFRLPVER